MRAMVLHQTGEVCDDLLHLEAIPVPEPGPGQIRIRSSICGICHTDLHTVEGDLTLARLPLVPGHQLVGAVDALGPGCTQHAVGDRVGVGWMYSTCGRCEYCLRGLENLCPDAKFTGFHANGGYAEYLIVDERFAYSIPSGFTDVEAAPLLCAGIVGFRALRLSEIQPGQRLGLYGFGASAHIVIQVARHWDCEVYVFTRSEHHRRLAVELGAGWAGGAEEDCAAPIDAGVLFAPAGWLVPAALKHLRPGGTLAINAIHMSPIPEMEYGLIYGERTVRSVSNFTRRDATEFLQLAAEIPVRTEVEEFSLTEANTALRRLKVSEIQGAAALRIT